MAKNQQNDLTNETLNCMNDEKVIQNFEMPQTSAEELTNGIYEKQQSLVEKANNTFRELCKTLENEQTKLLELEERRKRLQEEMLLLKEEIEQEKQSFSLNIVQSVQENLNKLNNNDKDEEAATSASARNVVTKNYPDILVEEPTIQEHVQYIRSELQNVLSECISEQDNSAVE